MKYINIIDPIRVRYISLRENNENQGWVKTLIR